ncbi:MAG TPA: DUF445 family protein [Clostridiales bacterium]|nr:DUF445 family protein [Clostridiales bacterium]
MQQFSFLLPPLLGLFVGYVTNSLAVRMLFRPYRALYLWKLRIPFTPGVIPKRQKDLGVAMGNMIQNHLLTATSIRKRLLSPDVRSAIVEQATSLLRYEIFDRSTGEVLERIAGTADAVRIKDQATEWIASRILNHLQRIDLYALLHEEVNSFLSEHLDSLTALLFGSDAIDALVRSAEQKMRNRLESDGEAYVRALIVAEVDALLGVRTDEILVKAELTEARISESIGEAYDRIIESSLLNLISAIDVAAIVENEIIQMDVRELETLIISIMKRELREIINLGGLIGLILGLLSLAA